MPVFSVQDDKGLVPTLMFTLAETSVYSHKSLDN